MKNKPFAHFFKTYGHNYIYDVNKNSIIRVQEDVWDLLKEGYDDENSTVKQLIENGFLSDNRVKAIVHRTDEVIADYINSKIGMITLQVTQICNLRCEYCVYSGEYHNRKHSNSIMSVDMAKKGINFLNEHSSDVKKVAIGFYGGEPLIEFDLIKEIIEYVKETIYGKLWIFSITTNGTLLNESIIKYFYENDVQLLISLDGPAEIHDKYRRFAHSNVGTFNKIIENIELIKRTYPEYLQNVKFNAVINQENDFTCINGFFNDFEAIKDTLWVRYSEIQENYKKSKAYLNEKYYQDINYEYFKVFLSKLGKLDAKYASTLLLSRFTDLENTYDHLIPTELLPQFLHHGGPCIPGTQRLFLNTHGEFFPCERVSETSKVAKIGDIENGLDLKKVKEILNVGKITEEHCKNCWAIRFCTQCVASADNGNILSAELKLRGCNSVRAIIEAKFKDICTLREFGYNF